MTSASVKKSSKSSKTKQNKEYQGVKICLKQFSVYYPERGNCFWEGYEINKEQLKPEVLHETSCGSQNNSNNKAKQKTSKQT